MKILYVLVHVLSNCSIIRLNEGEVGHLQLLKDAQMLARDAGCGQMGRCSMQS
jgi:hypothetical protein